MKKAVWILGAAAALLLAFLLSGAADTGGAVNKALRDGNERYGAAGYEEALQCYEAGLAESPEDGALNYNAGQAAFALEDYEKAAAYYEKSEESIQKYINSGNAGYKLGEAAGDAGGKMRYYSRALEAYREGIEKYPRDVQLKYNYETVKEKIRELAEEAEQDNAEENEENEENEEEQGGQDGDQSREDREQEGESREEREQDGESRDQESPDDNADDAQTGQQNTGQDGDESAGSGSRESLEQDGESRETAAQQDISEQDREAIARILEILERQEEEGLKNNREVVGGKGDQYGW